MAHILKSKAMNKDELRQIITLENNLIRYINETVPTMINDLSPLVGKVIISENLTFLSKFSKHFKSIELREGKLYYFDAIGYTIETNIINYGHGSIFVSFVALSTDDKIRLQKDIRIATTKMGSSDSINFWHNTLHATESFVPMPLISFDDMYAKVVKCQTIKSELDSALCALPEFLQNKI